MKKALTLSAALVFGALSFGNVAFAQGGAQLALIRDAETEKLLKDYAQPILRAAGLTADSVHPVLINDKTYNAFVVDSSRIFLNIGVIMDAESPNEVIGVLAHETGHIAGNHLVRVRQAASQAQLMAVVGVLLGAGALAAGAVSDSATVAESGVAVLGGGANVASRSLLAYKRGEEIAADRAAVTYLDRTKQSSQGLLKVFQRLAGQQLFAGQNSDPYGTSHPVPRDRISQLESVAKRSKFFNAKDPAALQLRHDLVRAKLVGYTSSPQTVANRYPNSDASLPADYARAVLTMRSGNIDRTTGLIDGLIARQPKNPYFWELKGQALIESGRARQSIAPFKQSLALAPSEGQLQIWYGYALVASEDPNLLETAVKNLRSGLHKNPNSSLGYRQLAIANSRLGRNAEADVATARGFMIAGRYGEAKQYAKRAQSQLEPGSGQWILADDILHYEPPEFP